MHLLAYNITNNINNISNTITTNRNNKLQVSTMFPGSFLLVSCRFPE